MRLEVAAIESALAPMGMGFHWVRVSESQSLSDYPYHLLWPSTDRPYGEVAIDGSDEATSTLLGLTTVALTPEAAREKGHAARRLLFPGGRALALPVAGRIARIQWSAFGSSQEDRSTPLPGTGTPGYPTTWVDMYLVTSYPI